MPEPRWRLDAAAEARVQELQDRLELVEGFELGLVLGPPDARAEVAARLRSDGPFLSERPAADLLGRLERSLPSLPPGRPVVWIEASAWEAGPWSAALAALNRQRDRLREGVPGLVLLAGPPELEPLALERPDLGSVVGPVVRLSGGPRAASQALSQLRWLHLSDLHVTADRRWGRRAVLQALLRWLRKDLVGTDEAPQLVLVTGDIACSGQPAEYEQAEDFFRELMATLELDPRQHLFLVPGNHDVDWGNCEGMARYVVEGLLREADTDAVERALTDPRTMSVLGDRLEAFYAFTHRLLGPARAWSAERPWRADAVEIEGATVGLVQLNSAWASGPDDRPQGLLVGAAQVREALAELPDAAVRIALTHHPASWLAEFDAREVAGILTGPGGVDFLLRGHLHDEEISLRVGPDGVVVDLAAGATHTGGPHHRGCLRVSLDGAAGTGTVHMVGYSSRGSGFWHPNGSRYLGAPKGAGPSPCPRASPALAAQTARYRTASVAYHGGLSFVGLADRSLRPTQVSVGELFVPVGAAPRGSAPDAPTLDPAGLAQRLLARDERGYAERQVILGDPGSGKTMLTRALAVWAAGGMELPGVERAEELVPLRIPFREYLADQAQHGREHLLDFLVRQANAALGTPRDRDFFEAALETGRALVLLDGLDEVAHPDERAETVARVRTFARQWPRSPMLVTSREVGYDDAPLPRPRRRDLEAATDRPESDPDAPRPFEHWVLRPLADPALDDLVRRWYRAREPVDRRLRDELAADLLGALAASPRVRELARNPLLATLICLVHGQRARLPGERVKLYHLVVDTLLDTWNQAKKGVGAFAELDPGRQRTYLEHLALALQEARASTDPETEEEAAAVAIPREQLVRQLAEIACRRTPGEDPRSCAHRMGRWVDWLAARTGLLVEQRPGVFGFLHLTLQEYLAACALDETRGAKGVDELVKAIRGRLPQPSWRETLRLVMGLRADDRAFVDALVAALSDGSPQERLLLAEGLIEELDVPPEPRRQLVVGLLEEPEDSRSAVGVLAQLTRFSPRHRDGVRRTVADTLRGWADDSHLSQPLLTSLVDLVGPDLDLVDHLRRRTRDGVQLYHLWAAVEQVGSAREERATEARALLDRFFDHVPPPDPELFSVVDTPLDGVVPLWRDVPAHTHWMGSPEGEEGRLAREGPRHRVSLTRAFRMGAVPVTVGQYAAFDPGHEPHRFTKVPTEERPHHPVQEVSWYAAVSFCRWLAAHPRLTPGARLPTEAEWELSARAGSETAFWSGDSEEELDRVGWYGGNSSGRTHRVGEKPANPWGLYDVHGNVWEWTSDWWRRVYASEAVEDPTGPPTGGGRVVRGGSFRNLARYCRSAFRAYRRPVDRYQNRGFRVVLAPAPQRRR